MRRWGWVAVGLAVLGAPAGAGAREGHKPRQIVRFDGDTIDGERTRPDGELSAVRPPTDPPSLVRPPESFARASRRTLLAAAAAASERGSKQGSEKPDGRRRDAARGGGDAADGAGASGGAR